MRNDHSMEPESEISSNLFIRSTKEEKGYGIVDNSCGCNIKHVSMTRIKHKELG